MKRLALLLVLAAWSPWTSPNPDVDAGNRAALVGKYDDALAAYARAAKDGSVDPAGLAYNRGTAELRRADAIKDPTAKQKAVGKALEDLKAAQRSADPSVRADAAYNRGNALMGGEQWADAAAAYKQALHDDPNLDDARINLELALKHRKQQQQKQQQGQQGQQQGQQGQQQGQQGQQQGQQQSQPQNGSNGQSGSNSQNGSNGQNGSAGGQPGQPQNGSNGTNGSNTQGSAGPQGSNDGSNSSGGGGSAGSNSQAQGGQQGSGGNSGQPGGNQQRGKSHGTHGQSPKTPTDHKLDDLEDFSRRMQKDGAKRHETGHTVDPAKDW
ncbi:MAG TPA: hypothetical protein VH143_00600 [Kofleriaceae bacterium]|nr:hypothetical protein [Kofleriaceae bacterium]